MSEAWLALFDLDGTQVNSHVHVIAGDVQAMENGIAQVLEAANG